MRQKIKENEISQFMTPLNGRRRRNILGNGGQRNVNIDFSQLFACVMLYYTVE